MNKTGYIEGLTGETIAVEIIAETPDGKYILRRPNGFTFYGEYEWLMIKEDVHLDKEVK